MYKYNRPVTHLLGPVSDRYRPGIPCVDQPLHASYDHLLRCSQPYRLLPNLFLLSGFLLQAAAWTTDWPFFSLICFYLMDSLSRYSILWTIEFMYMFYILDVDYLVIDYNFINRLSLCPNAWSNGRYIIFSYLLLLYLIILKWFRF